MGATRPPPNLGEGGPRHHGAFRWGDDEVRLVSVPLPTAPEAALTVAEREVVEFLRQGLSYRAVADARNVTVSTISNLAQKAFRKLGIHSRRELLRA